jgi:hypothetical protein
MSICRLVAATLGTALLGCTGLGAAEVSLVQKRALADLYPKAVFFRIPQNGYQDYAAWSGRFGALDGMIVKIGLEESPHLDWRLLASHLNRFALEHPEQLVLLHYNGRDRLIVQGRGIRERYFPGHWVYRAAAFPVGDIAPADAVLPVRNGASLVTLFRQRWAAENRPLPQVGLLVETDAEGRRLWNRSEYVALLAFDGNDSGGRVTVQRGLLGTIPRAFPAGRVHLAPMAAPHEWDYAAYNFSTLCPRDDEGRTAADRLVEEMAELFGPGGIIEALQGINFDVMYYELSERFDVDNDGRGDGGVVNGVTVYGRGVAELQARLRQVLGPNRLLLADGHQAENQRGVPWFNGMESEGIVSPRDSYREIAKTLNYFSYFARHAVQPRINFSFPKDSTIQTLADEDRIARYGQAVVASLGALSAHNILRVNRGEGGSLHSANRPAFVADELVAGVLNRRQWLGRPTGPYQLIGTNGLNLYSDAALSSAALRATANEANAFPQIILPSVATASGDVIATLEIRADWDAAYGSGVPAIVEMEAVGARDSPHSPKNVRALAGPSDWQPVIAYFREAGPASLQLAIRARHAGWLEVRNVRAYNAPLGLVRQFEHGVTLANLSVGEMAFDLHRLFGPARYRRLQGVQNPVVNDGRVEAGSVRLPAISGLFLHRE